VKAGPHLVVGAAAGWLAVWALQSAGKTLPADVLLAGPLVAAVGALVPDIDHPGSTVSRRIPRRLTHWALRIAAPVGLVVAVSLALHQTWVAHKAAEAGEPLLRLAGLLVLPAVVIVALSLLASLLFGHRGATHSLVFAGGASLLTAALCLRVGLSAWYGVFLGLGWLSHLAADSLGRRRLPSLLWPLAGRR